jgi:hypothetical protein
MLPCCCLNYVVMLPAFSPSFPLYFFHSGTDAIRAAPVIIDLPYCSS